MDVRPLPRPHAGWMETLPVDLGFDAGVIIAFAAVVVVL